MRLAKVYVLVAKVVKTSVAGVECCRTYIFAVEP